MKKAIGWMFFKFMGWKFDVSVPVHKISKCVLIAAPHTSNWDFFYAIFAFWYLKIPMKFYIKDSWTKPWYGFIIKALGGIGIDRSQNTNRVDFAVKMLKEADELYLLNTPEGSRSWVKQWKTGFYFIAEKAQVPIVLSYCDYEKKIAGIGKIIDVQNKSQEQVFKEVQDFYKDIKGKYPQNFNSNIY